LIGILRPDRKKKRAAGQGSEIRFKEERNDEEPHDIVFVMPPA
jgi:hypothetical protein